MEPCPGSALSIVKLGGSLIAADALRPCLALLAERMTPCVVVPGGGPFADTVRATQARLDLDELAAHRMAILAMQQYGLLLQALEPRLRLVERACEVEALVHERAAGVWLPWAMVGRDATLPASWDVTSDSLALVLATRLGAARLLLVKAASVPDGAASLAELARAGLIDAAFPRLRAAFSGEVRIVQATRLLAAESGRRW
jgi:aspartokinase-like uncharacterized kinase